MPIPLLSRLFSRKTSVPKSKALSLKQQGINAGYKAWLRYLDTNPAAALKYGAVLAGQEIPSIEEQIWERELASNPTIRAKFVEMQLQKKGMEGADWMTQFRNMREFFDEVGGEKRSNGFLSNLLGPDTIPVALAFLGRLMDAQGIPGAKAITQPQGRIASAQQQEALNAATVHSNEEIASVNSDNHTMNGHEERGSDDGREIPPDPIRSYVDFAVSVLTREDVEPEIAAQVLMGRLNEVAGSVPKEAQADVEAVYDMITQSPDVMLFAITAQAMSSNNPAYKDAAKRLNTQEGRSYLARFCLERDRILREMAESNEK